MEGKDTACTTGILIDFDDHGSITNEADLQLNLHKPTSDAEKIQSFDSSESLSVAERLNDLHLDNRPNPKREMLAIPEGRWETPSPKSMKKIRHEASKIIDQLHSSPIETTEAFLIDEEFPASLPSDEGSSDGFSPESEKSSERNIHSTKDNMSATFPPIKDRSCPVSEKVPERNENSTDDNIPLLSKPSADAQVSSLKVHSPDASKPADIKLKSSVPKNFTPSIENSELISTSTKSKNMNEYASKLITGCKMINKENSSKRKTIISSGIKPLSDKKFFKRNILEEANLKAIGIEKSKPNVENSSKKNSINVIPEKVHNITNLLSQTSAAGANKRSSIILPRTSSASQYQLGPRQKTTLCKTTSVVETPKASKFVRRSNSFQAQIEKNSAIKKYEASSMPKPLISVPKPLISVPKPFISAKDSVKKISNLKTPIESSIKPVNSRMSTSQLPSTGNRFNAPLKRSNSLSKKSGICSSQIPGPSNFQSSRKITSVAENDRNLFKRPVVSTSSRVRFTTRIFLPSPLPGEMNDNLCRELFPDE